MASIQSVYRTQALGGEIVSLEFAPSNLLRMSVGSQQAIKEVKWHDIPKELTQSTAAVAQRVLETSFFSITYFDNGDCHPHLHPQLLGGMMRQASVKRPAFTEQRVIELPEEQNRIAAVQRNVEALAVHLEAHKKGYWSGVASTSKQIGEKWEKKAGGIGWFFGRIAGAFYGMANTKNARKARAAEEKLLDDGQHIIQAYEQAQIKILDEDENGAHEIAMTLVQFLRDKGYIHTFTKEGFILEKEVFLEIEKGPSFSSGMNVVYTFKVLIFASLYCVHRHMRPTDSIIGYLKGLKDVGIEKDIVTTKLFALALFLADKTDYEEAIAYLRRIPATDPGHEHVENYIAALEEKRTQKNPQAIQ